MGYVGYFDITLQQVVDEIEATVAAPGWSINGASVARVEFLEMFLATVREEGPRVRKLFDAGSAPLSDIRTTEEWRDASREAWDGWRSNMNSYGIR